MSTLANLVVLVKDPQLILLIAIGVFVGNSARFGTDGRGPRRRMFRWLAFGDFAEYSGYTRCVADNI